MAYYQSNSYTTTGTKASINLDPAIAPFNCMVAWILRAPRPARIPCNTASVHDRGGCGCPVAHERGYSALDRHDAFTFINFRLPACALSSRR